MSPVSVKDDVKQYCIISLKDVKDNTNGCLTVEHVSVSLSKIKRETKLNQLSLSDSVDSLRQTLLQKHWYALCHVYLFVSSSFHFAN